jgi:hypothetical protein
VGLTPVGVQRSNKGFRQPIFGSFGSSGRIAGLTGWPQVSAFAGEHLVPQGRAQRNTALSQMEDTRPRDTAQDGPSEAAAEPAIHAILPQWLRLAMLAAALAAAATIGAFVGSLSVGGVAQFWPQIAPSSSNVAASGGAQAAKTELAELSALKTDLEGVARNLNNQFAKLAERLDRMERAEADLHAKLAHIGEAVDRLEMARESVKASDAAPAGVAITGTIPNSSSASAEPEPCRIGSCTPCAGAMRWSKIATATFSRSPAAGRSLGRRDRAGAYQSAR